LLFGAVLVVPFSLFVEGFDFSRVDSQGIFALLFTAVIGTFFGMILSLYNIQKFGATAAVMTTYVIPVVSSLVGVIFLGEKITRGMVAGILIISIGVWLIRGAGGKKIPVTYA
jgi:drug/metabolite transporter (DMT)-like permease